MKRAMLGLGMAVAFGWAGLAAAEGVNCKQVNKYLQTGRSTKEVAETMVVDEEDVKKCQEQAGQQGGGAAQGGEEKK